MSTFKFLKSCRFLCLGGLFALFVLLGTAHADGFRCEGQGFQVLMYNHIQPKSGTRNPAVLIIFKEKIGTVAQLFGDGIQKTLGPAVVTYQGQAHSRHTGHFVFANLQVERAHAPIGGRLAHRAILHFNYEYHRAHAELVCERYLKHPY